MQIDSEDHEQLGDRLTTARAWQQAIRLLMATFETSLVVSPAWDLLIDLYLGKFEKRETSISSLSAGLNIPAATMSRYVIHLRGLGLLEVDDSIAGDQSPRVVLTALGTAKINGALDGTNKSNKQLGIAHLRLVK